MSGVGAKLSRHVLGMKFMRKTKEQIDKDKVKVEKVHREQFTPASTSSSAVKSEGERGIKSEVDTASSSPIVQELWSYNQCERYIFGRQSFGGFNPVVEKNVKKGIWKPFYLEDSEIAQESDDDDEDIKKSQSDVDVSDEEMAKTYGSIVGTLAKRFRKRHKMEEASDNKKKTDNKRNKKPSKWNKRFQKNKNSEGGKSSKEHQNQNQGGGGGKGWNWKGGKKRQFETAESTQQRRDKKEQGFRKRGRGRGKDNRDDDRNQDAPPFKKRKFLKPTDD